ncbi:uncharacterized protein PHALS_14020 [Plasmopara halstedii]|uniref:RxLR-like protein n=1 Tax=Plasmopara halstedii TaxID=4781 RepID=A0A0P1AQU2_PLAHL|nr:uncharacterized protein PHALS_14020 [Plasmopara halstedii]CEG43726.1 hypothetical protein PHALS_14020 [Plasmopara halstedii]|eukprot:XP_024580095.1 hypothetical protein PHALS_14020 [Plasmopara halstedii]
MRLAVFILLASIALSEGVKKNLKTNSPHDTSIPHSNERTAAVKNGGKLKSKPLKSLDFLSDTQVQNAALKQYGIRTSWEDWEDVHLDVKNCEFLSDFLPFLISSSKRLNLLSAGILKASAVQPDLMALTANLTSRYQNHKQVISISKNQVADQDENMPRN